MQGWIIMKICAILFILKIIEILYNECWLCLSS
jgi:hypothetical protein